MIQCQVYGSPWWGALCLQEWTVWVLEHFEIGTGPWVWKSIVHFKYKAQNHGGPTHLTLSNTGMLWRHRTVYLSTSHTKNCLKMYIIYIYLFIYIPVYYKNKAAALAKYLVTTVAWLPYYYECSAGKNIHAVGAYTWVNFTSLPQTSLKHHIFWIGTGRIVT